MLKTERRDSQRDKTEKQRKEREKREIARLQKESKERIKKEKKEREKREKKERKSEEKKKTPEGSVTPKKPESIDDKKEEEIFNQLASMQIKEETSNYSQKQGEAEEEEKKNALKKESSYVSEDEEKESRVPVRLEGGEYGETNSQESEEPEEREVLSVTREPLQEQKVINNISKEREAQAQQAKEREIQKEKEKEREREREKREAEKRKEKEKETREKEKKATEKRAAAKGKETRHADDYYDPDEEDPSWFQQEEIEKEEEEEELIFAAETDDHAWATMACAQLHYEVLTRDVIVKRQEEALNQVRAILGDAVPVSAARILLQYYRWDTMIMLNEYADDREKVCARAGISLPIVSDKEKEKEKEKDKDKIITCQICYDDVESRKITSLACGHQFCSDCWNEYLNIEIKSKKKSITCPGYTPNKLKCPLVVDEALVIRLLGDIDKEQKFLDTLVDSYVEDNPRIKWCPNPYCTNAVFLKEVSLDQNEAVTCLCSHTFCFRCLSNDHRPASCMMLELWKKKNSGSDETMDNSLIAAISRPCPSCKVPIQKNDGCNHMNCSQCGYHFCWLCMGRFGSGPKGGQDGYGSHKCNNHYQDDEEVLMKKEEIERFTWYSERYNLHLSSKKMEMKLLENIDKVEKEIMQLTGLSSISTHFYRRAIEQLVLNRNALMHSYIFGYFRPLYSPYVNKMIFENIQLELETHSEKLSKLLTSSSTEKLISTQQMIIKQTEIAHKVLSSMLDAASEWSVTQFSLTSEKEHSEDGEGKKEGKNGEKKKNNIFRKLLRKIRN